jgi:cyclase
MYRTLIVARIRPGAEPDVARLFKASDATTLPKDLGVQRRSLYSLDELYLHVIDHQEPDLPLREARGHPGFKQISDDLRPFISAYDPATWRSPQDAVAKEFYHWSANR